MASILIFLIQELEDRSQLDRSDVREKIREALENGVRRMNLVERQRETVRHREREPLSSTIKKLDQLQQDIEQSFDTVRKEFRSQGKLLLSCLYSSEEFKSLYCRMRYLSG